MGRWAKRGQLVLFGILLIGMMAACENEANKAEETAKPLTEKEKLAKLAWDINLEPIGADDPGQTSVVHDDAHDTYIFSYAKGDMDIVYKVNYGSDNVKKGLIEVTAQLNDNDPITAVSEAGTYYLPLNGEEMSPAAFAQAADSQMTAAFEDDKLILTYKETYEGTINQKTYSFSIKNKSLIVHAQSDGINGKGGYSAFGTGKSKTAKSASRHTSVYVEEVSVTLADKAYFLSAYLDKAKTFGTLVENRPASSAKSTVHGMTARYELNSAGQTNPLDEYLYITVSDEFLDCVYLTNAEKSEYRDMLTDLIIYDTWEIDSSYQDRKKHFEMLATEHGLKDMLLIDHRWQRDSLDISNPVFYPASTMGGTAEEFQDYVDTVIKKLGWKFALHEDYWFMFPSKTNQYWNAEGVEDKIAQDASGNFRSGWLNSSYANKSDAMLEYAKTESSLIKENYGTNAAFLDVNGGVDPSYLNQVTLNAESRTSRTLAQVVADNVALFEGMKEIYKGPIMSEGAQGERSFGSAYAGHIDAVEREITGINNGQIMPDYELKYIRPLMANQGMGYPGRFQLNANRFSFDYDKYNTASIAYGHTGFIGDIHTGMLNEQINTYYMFKAIQPQYLDTSVHVEQITYFDTNGTPYDLNEAIKNNYGFIKARLYIKYSNGLEIYLNFSDSDWKVNLNGNTYVLDMNGYAAENPSAGFVQFSCLLNGVRVDYVDSKEYTYVNPRDNTVDFGGGLVADKLTIVNK